MMTEYSDSAEGGKRFLHPPFAGPDGAADETQVIRSIVDFIDEVPPIDDFLDSSAISESDETLPWIDEFAPPDIDEGGWAISEWQSYDWMSLAGLQRDTGPRAATDAEWGDSDWARAEGQVETARAGAFRSGEFHPDEPTAHEIALALNEIARRIRSGELAIDRFDSSAPGVKMTEALLTLLRTRG